jgi:aryl-alcohol dehydrogenase-like predicted oxidoreductase
MGMKMSKLGLGTVQFGSDYGVSNKHGITLPGEVSSILDFAEKNGISKIDTAALYGSSEEILGKNIKQIHGFDIITKSLSFNQKEVGEKDANRLIAAFNKSLINLKQTKIYALLMHNADDLLVVGGERLYQAMLSLKNAGRVQKIGVSVYTASQVSGILEKYDIDIIQLPTNILDQRLLQSGEFKEIRQKGIEIHMRSVFLQGLLLMPLNEVPLYFSPILPVLAEYHAFLKDHQMNPVEGALCFANQVEEVDTIIIGVNSLQQLVANCSDFKKINNLRLDFSPFAIQDESFLNPFFWKLG